MNLQSVKTRFIGSYLFLLILFIIQIPIIYTLVEGMSEKYTQVDQAGALRKKAVELADILNRHILSGNEALEKTFQAKKAEYTAKIEEFKNGSADLPALTEPEALEKLASLDKSWKEMEKVLDNAMEDGDGLRLSKAEVEDTTFTTVDRINEMILSFEGLKDPAYVKYINVSGLERMRTVKLSYLLERYILSYEDREAVAADINKTIAEFDETLEELRKASNGVASRGEKGQRLITSVSGVEAVWAARKEMINTAIKANDSYHERITELTDVLTPKIVVAANELTATISGHAREAAMSGIFIMAVSVLVSAAFAVLFMWSTNKQVIMPIVKLKEAVEDISEGDLTRRANLRITFLGREIKDEITALGGSIDVMAGQMSQVIGRITDSSNHLASASEQLSTSAAQISEGANKQSNQTAHVATAMEEMNATVVEVARNSQQASESARTAQDVAEKGGTVVNQAISAMQEVAESTTVTADTIKRLGKSSEEIGTIVSVINDIADQTNLLALNAAIEAARAGEQGRGFAVVADEVRKLAERTTKATKEISAMIKAIQDETGKAVHAMDEGTSKVENGVNLANEAGDSLKQIFAGVENVTDMIGHIATSAEQQSATTEEITQNMDSIADVARTNVAAIGEVSKATNELAHLASELKELVSRFKISKEGTTGLKAVPDNVTPISSKKNQPKSEPRLRTIENA